MESFFAKRLDQNRINTNMRPFRIQKPKQMWSHTQAYIPNVSATYALNVDEYLSVLYSRILASDLDHCYQKLYRFFEDNNELIYDLYGIEFVTVINNVIHGFVLSKNISDMLTNISTSSGKKIRVVKSFHHATTTANSFTRAEYSLDFCKNCKIALYSSPKAHVAIVKYQMCSAVSH